MSRIASLHENEAQQRLAGGDGAALAAGLFLEKAIATIRELPRRYREANGLDIRLRALRNQLADNREATLEAMIGIETDPVDISQYVSSARRSVSGKDKFDALATLATVHPLIDAEQARSDAAKDLRGTMTRTIGRSTIAGDGPKLASDGGAVAELQEQEIWSEVVRSFSYRIGLITVGFIMRGRTWSPSSIATA